MWRQTGALATFQQARRLFPDNISALLNLPTIAQTESCPKKRNIPRCSRRGTRIAA